MSSRTCLGQPRPPAQARRSAVDVAVSFDDELAGDGDGVDELLQQRVRTVTVTQTENSSPGVRLGV
jgi:hypothetical protein